MGTLELRGLSEAEAEMWAVCSHEAAHAIGGIDDDVDAAVSTSKLRARIHVPLLWGPVDSSGEMWGEGIDTRVLDGLSIAQVRTLQIVAVAGGVGEIRFRTEELNQPRAATVTLVGAHCGGDEEIMSRYLPLAGAMTVAQAEDAAERKLERYEDRWLDLTERLVESGGALGGRFFEWSSTVKV